MNRELDIAGHQFADASPRPAPVVLYQDDQIEILAVSGEGSTGVVAFAGAQQKVLGDDVQAPEFLGTASRAGATPALFVRELNPSWYSQPQAVETIISVVLGWKEDNRLTQLYGLGSSMGGYAAIKFSRALEFSRVLAIVPQISMHPDTIDEKRWVQHRPNFGSDVPANVFDSASTDCAIKIAYGHDIRDEAQIALVPSGFDVEISKFNFAGHNVAHILKQKNALQTLVRNALWLNEPISAPAVLGLGTTEPTSAQNFETLEEAPDLVIRYVEGTGSKLVLSFRGIGTGGGTGRPEEFWGSISQGGQNHLLFIADMIPSWYNHRGMIARIKDHIAQIVDRVQPRQIFAIGNSMGGYGACVFSRDFAMDGVIAICPQATLNQKLVADRRWAKYARAQRAFRAPHIAECLMERTRYTIMHGIRGLESVQADAVPHQANVRHFVFPGVFHALAPKLKDEGHLKPLIGSVLDGEYNYAEQILQSAGGRLKAA